MSVAASEPPKAAQGRVGDALREHSVTPPPAFAPPVTLPGTPTSTPPPTTAPQAPRAEDPGGALQRLDDLRARNLITEEEYQEKRRTILDEL